MAGKPREFVHLVGSRQIVCVEKGAYEFLRAELSKYKRALKVAKERISRHWSGNSEDTCVEIQDILNED